MLMSLGCYLVGQFYTCKQLLNIHSFSVLRQWLHHTRHWLPTTTTTYTDLVSDQASSSVSSKYNIVCTPGSDTSSSALNVTESQTRTDSTGPGSNSPSTPTDQASFFEDFTGVWSSPSRQDSPLALSSGRSSPGQWSVASGWSANVGAWAVPPESVSMPSSGNVHSAALMYCMRLLKQAMRSGYKSST